MTNNATGFTANFTRIALEEACRSIGLDPTGAILVRTRRKCDVPITR